tara:strand:+ start:5565 stop:6218 length:654 start_codon:yes stop_codon:yes gene_type:complete
MIYNPNRHDLPSPLVSNDAPLSSDVTGRSVEAIKYLWQVTTNSADASGTALPANQGHTHDGRNDQTIFAESSAIAGWSCGFGSPFLEASSSSMYISESAPMGGWIMGAGAVSPIRSVVHVPFDVTLKSPDSAAVAVNVLIEKGATLSAANSALVTVTLGTVTLTANSAVAAVGLEVITVGPFAAAAMTGGPKEMTISLASAISGDYVRLWHSSVITL